MACPFTVLFIDRIFTNKNSPKVFCQKKCYKEVKDCRYVRIIHDVYTHGINNIVKNFYQSRITYSIENICLYRYRNFILKLTSVYQIKSRIYGPSTLYRTWRKWNRYQCLPTCTKIKSSTPGCTKNFIMDVRWFSDAVKLLFGFFFGFFLRDSVFFSFY